MLCLSAEFCSDSIFTCTLHYILHQRKYRPALAVQCSAIKMIAGANVALSIVML